MSETGGETPDSLYAKVGVDDDELPEDLQPGEENPLAQPADDDALADGDPESTPPTRRSEESTGSGESASVGSDEDDTGA